MPFELLMYAPEAVKGTAIAAPTHYAYMPGTMTPAPVIWRPNGATGRLGPGQRGKKLKDATVLDAAGLCDVKAFSVLASQLIDATPVLTSLVDPLLFDRAFTPSVSSDNLKSATWWWGDPNVQMWQSAYGMLTEATLETDASSDEGSTLSLSGYGRKMTPVSMPALPTESPGSLIVPNRIDARIGTSSYTANALMTGKVVRCSHTFRNGSYGKWLGEGAAATTSFSRHGRSAAVGSETRIELEVFDTVIFDMIQAGDPIRIRATHRGDFIMTVAATDHYFHILVDMYGAGADPEWGENGDGNRTLAFTLYSLYDTSLGADYRVTTRTSYATI